MAGNTSLFQSLPCDVLGFGAVAKNGMRDAKEQGGVGLDQTGQIRVRPGCLR